MLSPIDHERELNYFRNILGIESLDQVIRNEQGGIGHLISNKDLAKELDLLKKGKSDYKMLVFESKGVLTYDSLGPSTELIFSKLVVERIPKETWYKREGLNFTTISENNGYKRENNFRFRYTLPLGVTMKKKHISEERIIFENWGDIYELEVSRLCLSPPSFLSIKTKIYEKSSTISGYKLKK